MNITPVLNASVVIQLHLLALLALGLGVQLAGKGHSLPSPPGLSLGRHDGGGHIQFLYLEFSLWGPFSPFICQPVYAGDLVSGGSGGTPQQHKPPPEDDAGLIYFCLAADRGIYLFPWSSFASACNG